ncbi:MAG: Nif3-like dinuclear metal center hexameric protein [Legionella sp.]|nr:MAG: Nif3-like dinuclear metal center hexameric protein [Legionella sp.]
MISRDALALYLDKYLSCNALTDYAPNGLQIEGRPEIQRICSAVSISRDVIQQAAQWEADALLVHHGFFWRGERSVITGIRRQRMGALIHCDLNLFAYHLPLDVHPVVGNNACLAKRLPVTNLSQHDVEKIPKGLWSGTLSHLFNGKELGQLLKDVFLQQPIHIAAESRPIQSIAWCSGAAQDFLEEAHHLGVDAYISGEISERTFDLAKELNIHYYACGHHATERYGVQALGAHLEQLFDIEHRFIDTHNPI